MELIDKSAVIAKINLLQDSTMDEDDNFCTAQAQAEYDILCVLEEYLDTLEVKEVDLEKELDFVKDAYYYFTSDERNSMKKVAKHFFELGLKVQKEE